MSVIAYSLFTDFDIDLFKVGKHYKLYEKFGSHSIKVNGIEGTYFAVWAPSAKNVSVIGDFNYWIGNEHQLNVRWDESGIWEGFIPHVSKGNLYKYKIESHNDGIITEKADPYAKRCEHPPSTASIVWDDDNYKWKDKKWQKQRKKHNSLHAPFSIYEVHLGSWKKHVEEHRYLSYFELADQLVSYVKNMNFTHVELLPVMEHPFDPSWGYQITGYFAPTSRFGYPEEFKFLIDKFHENGIGVILDWVPSHFPEDAHGLGFFDGSCLYEHPDKRKGYHPDWKSLIFNYGRNEVKSFLISNALFWIDQYHIDGLRVDAVASMLYLDYSRNHGEWELNEEGGRENLEAIRFLKELNEAIYSNYPYTQVIAEESTTFPMVSRPTSIGGLGFGMKWMMGWMHDTLNYFATDPLYRKFYHNQLTFGLMYAFTENFVLPFSHDEVVHGKSSLIGRMPGDEWQRFANLRLLYSYMYVQPGAKLLFQGAEFGQYNEWNHQESLDWHLLQYPLHKGVQTLVKDINKLYKKEPALHKKQFSSDGFEWIEANNNEESIYIFMRKSADEKDDLIIVCNMTPNSYKNYTLGLSKKGAIKEIFNSDNTKYNGSGKFKNRKTKTTNTPWHFRAYSAQINVPPLALVIFKYAV